MFDPIGWPTDVRPQEPMPNQAPTVQNVLPGLFGLFSVLDQAQQLATGGAPPVTPLPQPVAPTPRQEALSPANLAQTKSGAIQKFKGRTASRKAAQTPQVPQTPQAPTLVPPEIPRLQTGGVITPTQPQAVVGETGPELATLTPGGTVVTPLETPEPVQPPLKDPYSDYYEMVERIAAEEGVDPELVKHVMRKEGSGGDLTKLSPKGATGLMQVMPGTFADMGGQDIADPEQNIRAGTRYLKQQLDAFGGDVPKALAAYNAGPGKVQRYGGIPPYPETKDYVETIMARLGGQPTTMTGVAPHLRKDKAGNFVGALPPEDMISQAGGAGQEDPPGFREWYTQWAAKTGLNPDPDDPRHKYDYRAAFKAGVEPKLAEDGQYHWDSRFKATDHPNRYVDGVDTITGEAARTELGAPPPPSEPDPYFGLQPEVYQALTDTATGGLDLGQRVAIATLAMNNPQLAASILGGFSAQKQNAQNALATLAATRERAQTQATNEEDTWWRQQRMQAETVLAQASKAGIQVDATAAKALRDSLNAKNYEQYARSIGYLEDKIAERTIRNQQAELMEKQAKQFGLVWRPEIMDDENKRRAFMEDLEVESVVQALSEPALLNQWSDYAKDATGFSSAKEAGEAAARQVWAYRRIPPNLLDKIKPRLQPTANQLYATATDSWYRNKKLGEQQAVVIEASRARTRLNQELADLNKAKTVLELMQRKDQLLLNIQQEYTKARTGAIGAGNLASQNYETGDMAKGDRARLVGQELDAMALEYERLANAVQSQYNVRLAALEEERKGGTGTPGMPQSLNLRQEDAIDKAKTTLMKLVLNLEETGKLPGSQDVADIAQSSWLRPGDPGSIAEMNQADPAGYSVKLMQYMLSQGNEVLAQNLMRAYVWLVKTYAGSNFNYDALARMLNREMSWATAAAQGSRSYLNFETYAPNAPPAGMPAPPAGYAEAGRDWLAKVSPASPAGTTALAEQQAKAKAIGETP